MKLPVTVRNDLKTLETIEKLFGKPASSERATWLSGINRREKKLKYNSAAIWTILNLMSDLKIYLQIAEMCGNKHIGYFYEKENFMANTILKLR